MIQKYANPARFNRLAGRLMPWFAWPAGVLILGGLYFALIASPADYQQGETVRIMYVHVPSAWMALFVYSSMAIASAVGLIWKHPLAHLSAEAAAPIGACFTFLCLFTGSLWGKPMWGTWWVWDARLTSVLVLFFLYLGYMALNSAFDDPSRGERSAAILALIGFINVPIIKFSVDWWNTLHQPASVVKLSGPAIHASMLVPLLMMAVGFTLFFFAVLLLRMRALMLARRARGLTLAGLHDLTTSCGQPAKG
jgi:heme exporter protein C